MSKTPQPDPQGSGETGPAQPLPQGMPGWGPAAQAPGQLPPPPGQAPPPVPPQSPGTSSAWSQPVPATSPLSGGPGSGRPGGARTRPWLIGGGAALAVAAIVGVVIAMSGGDGESAAEGKQSGAPGGAAEPQAPTAAGKSFTKVPEGCRLIKASTIARIAPGTECKPSQFDNSTMAAMITRMPSWDTPFGSGGGQLRLQVNLTVGPSASGMFDIHKKSALEALKKVRTTTDSRSLSGLGEDAYLVHGVDKDPFDLAEAQVIVREGNAEFTVSLTYDTKDSGRNQQQAEDAVVAAARDVLGSLS
ncbi:MULTISPECIES: hypothetical protein [Streptomyces]|uniref:hypothetical protein n=1 Tax=Streptomyces TaxID=1883 RepID=UPI001EE6377C|nr:MULTISPECIES: hypothetical protein [Streptomyces]